MCTDFAVLVLTLDHSLVSFAYYYIILLFQYSGSSNLINDVWLYSIADGSWRKVRGVHQHIQHYLYECRVADRCLLAVTDT
jgi:hypothetical protein